MIVRFKCLVCLGLSLIHIYYLQSQGVIYNKRGIGYFVSVGAGTLILSLRKEYFLKEEADYFFRQIYTLGISGKELLEMYREFTEQQK